ncbi:MAG TPA: hypothetical protein VGF69_04770 [Thermoanaerobaculia bacterium]
MALCFAPRGRADSECVSAYYAANTAGSIGVIADSGVSEAWISGGVDQWGVCGADSFPTLYCNQPGDYTFTVFYQPIKNPDGAGCGSADPDVDLTASGWQVRGGAIYLFERDGFGFPCNNTTEARAHTVAHEIGHILGLADSDCTNRVMGGSTGTVQPDECAKVGELWETPMERQVNQCNSTCWTACDANAQCPEGTLHTDSGTPWFDPLVFDLEGDGIPTVSGDEAVRFDLDADGTVETVSWPGSGDAFLWTDLNGNNRVDDGAELFGVGMLLPDGRRARHGYEALAMYDLPSKGGNGDGRIDSTDAIWNRLRLWRDIHHDGICGAGEASPIHRFGVKAIDLAWSPTGWTDAAGTLHLLSGRFRKHVRGKESGYADYPVEALGLRKLN